MMKPGRLFALVALILSANSYLGATPAGAQTVIKLGTA